MMKLNYHFAKPTLKADGTPDYAPTVIRVPTHHHEEWDEPVIDPETGEPTGETEHKSRDWDTWRTEVRPTAADYHAAGFIDVLNNPAPSDPAPEGKHWEPRGWKIEPESATADRIVRVYVVVDDPPAPPRTFSKYRLVAALMDANLWDGVKAWIESQEGAYDLYLAAEDISEDEPLLAQGIAALKAELGITDEQVEAILAASVKEGA